MFAPLGRFIAKNWLGVILFWVGLLIVSRWSAPHWDEVTHDGDFAYLPQDRPSVAGQRLMAEAFPEDQAKSQIAILIAQNGPKSGQAAKNEMGTVATLKETPLKDLDACAAFDVARRFLNIFGAVSLHRAGHFRDAAEKLNQQGNLARAKSYEGKAAEAIAHSNRALDNAVAMDEQLAELTHRLLEAAAQTSLDQTSLGPSAYRSRLTALPGPLCDIYHNRALLMDFTGRSNEARKDRADAKDFLRSRLEQVWAAAQINVTAARDLWDIFTRAADTPDSSDSGDSHPPKVEAEEILLQDFERLLASASQFKRKWLLQEIRQAADRWRRFARQTNQTLPSDASRWALLDVWTWNQEIIGDQLLAKDPEDPDQIQARLVILHLANEFMATDNIRVLQRVEAELAVVRDWLDAVDAHEVRLAFSGSAAIGGDALRAAAASIRNTELAAILLVTMILVVIYRSPLLVAVPLIVIVISFLVATNLVALLTQLHEVFSWWDFKVFKTTKIFIVVILYGAGVDYCLFLIARYREELQNGANSNDALSKALAGVGDALTASAMTTIVGLGMMYFAEFGKFKNSGPAIAFCLLVTLCASLTLAPALLRVVGPIIFWPTKVAHAPRRAPRGFGGWLWERIAHHTVARPGLVLLVCLGVMVPLAAHGGFQTSNVTYDFLTGMGEDRPSRRGAQLMRRYFPVGESGPVVILARQEGVSFLQSNGEISYRERDAIWDLTKALSEIEGVRSVRSFGEPTGGAPLQRSTSTKITQQTAAFTKSLYITQVPALHYSVTRLEVILEYDPFSLEAADILKKIDAKLAAMREDPHSFWRGGEFFYTGVTAGVRDLREVTQSDNRRIQILVVAAVFVVLVLILRRPLICVYLIATVLLSYYVTIGVTELVFHTWEGDAYPGFNWKTPLFLFVILVAVGQDYNVYLASRVFEEQRLRGPRAGLRRAIIATGGIITSCGVIMAGTFISMTSAIWPDLLPANTPFIGQVFSSAGYLRSMVELGFALSFGVLLDTLVVRSILVPAFFAILARRETAPPPTNSTPQHAVKKESN